MEVLQTITGYLPDYACDKFPNRLLNDYTLHVWDCIHICLRNFLIT